MLQCMLVFTWNDETDTSLSGKSEIKLTANIATVTDLEVVSTTYAGTDV